MSEISWADFERIEMRVGRVLRAMPSAKAKKPSYRLEIDFGPAGTKISSAQLTHLYRPEDLVGRLVAAVTNFPAKHVAHVRSEVLVLGVPLDNGEVVLLNVDRDVPLGSRIA